MKTVVSPQTKRTFKSEVSVKQTQEQISINYNDKTVCSIRKRYGHIQIQTHIVDLSDKNTLVTNVLQTSPNDYELYLQSITAHYELPGDICTDIDMLMNGKQPTYKSSEIRPILQKSTNYLIMKVEIEDDQVKVYAPEFKKESREELDWFKLNCECFALPLESNN